MPEEERKGLEANEISVSYNKRGWERTRMAEASYKGCEPTL